MKQIARICAAALIMVLPACIAETTTHKARPAPKPDATAPELFEYVRSALLLLTPEDGVNDNLEVTFNWNTNVMTVSQPSGHCDLFMNALNSNGIAWDVFDPSDSHESRERLVRLTLVSVSGAKARICYDKAGHVDDTVPGNRIRFLFADDKVDQWPGFKDKLTKAFKRFIVLSGGAPEVKLF